MAERAVPPECHRATPSRTRATSPGLHPATDSLRRQAPGVGPVDRERATHLSKISTRISRRLPAAVDRGRRVLRFTPLHPLSPAGCPPLRRSLPVWRAPGEWLVLLNPEGSTALRRRRSLGAPRRDALARRVTGGREQHEREAPSADDEHPEAPAHASLREHSAVHRARSDPSPAEVPSTRYGHDRNRAQAPDTARRLLQST